MSTYNICFRGEIRKNINIFGLKNVSYLDLWLMPKYAFSLGSVYV